jgi:hypothetical protein
LASEGAPLRLAIEHMLRRYRLYYDLPDAKPAPMYYYPFASSRRDIQQ